MTRQGRSLANPIDVQHATATVVEGGFVAVQYHSVYVMVFSGTDRDARRRALAAKRDDDLEKPMSVLSSAAYVFPLVDRSRITNQVTRALIDDIERFRRTLGAICHVRLPLIREVIGSEIPPHLVSTREGTPYMQLLEPRGNVLFSNLVTELEAAGIKYVSATSLNLAGESEITDPAAAEAFCAEAEVPLLLHDPLFAAKDVIGSFPAVDVERSAAVRGGHVPLELIDRLVGVKFDRTNATPEKHPHSEFLLSLIEQPDLKGEGLRETILCHFYRSH